MSKKPTAERPEVSPRVAEAIRLRQEGLRPTAVVQLVAQRFRVTERTAWRDVKAADDWIADAFLADRGAVKRKLLQFYTRHMEEAAAEGDRASARAFAADLAKLTGANEPDQVEHTGSTGVLVVNAMPASPEDWASKYAPRPKTDQPEPSKETP